MTRTIVFKNNGEIDLRLITTLGVNVKENASAIGYFGTGLKYAIAVLLRENCNITIYSGLNRIKFSKKTDEIRGKNFDFIEMNLTTLGFTTELGKNWKLNDAFRELFSNVKDEHGDAFESNCDIEPIEGMTQIIIRSNEFAEIYDERGKYFINESNKKCLQDNKSCQIFYGEDNSVFFRGVKVKDIQQPALYTYNIKDYITLSEDRIAVYDFQIREAVVSSLNYLEDEEIIENIISADKHHFEYNLDFTCGKFQQNDLCKKIVVRRMKEFKPVNRTLINFYKEQSDDIDDYVFELYQMDSLEKKSIDRAVSFLEKIGFEISKYNVVVVKELGDLTMGKAYKNKIYLSRKCFDHGVKYIASTILEEFIHLDEKLYDETRELQTFLFDKICTLGEKIVQEAL